MEDKNVILDLTQAGPLGVCARDAIARVGAVRRPDVVGDPVDLFMSALGCRRIVYAAASDLLDARLEPRPSPERMRSVVRAAQAPGVGLVVAVLPSDDRFTVEEEPLKKDGVPYVIVRAAPLVEEIAQAANFHVARSLWLDRSKTLAVSTAADLTRSIAQALQDDALQGATVDVPHERLDVAEVLRRAAHVAGAHTAVRSASGLAGSIACRVSRWFERPEPSAHALYERLLSVA